MNPTPPTRAAVAAAEAATLACGHRIQADSSFAFGSSLQISRFHLDNGLCVLLAQDDRAPIFAYQSWFGVGSKNEDPNRTGLAHLFEHLMFKGTKRFASGTFDAEMEKRGAQTNAATWVDWTYYTQALTCRGDNLETVIAFEADRMHNLVLDEKTFRSELEVVKNERRMAVEDSIGGALSEHLMAQAFTVHPYRWPTIGSMAHLEATSIDDLERFYRRHYAPNNACVVVCGDIEWTQTLKLIGAAYGPLQAQPLHVPDWPQEPEQTEARHISIVRSVLTPQIVIGYRAPPQGSRAHFALEMLIDVLTEGDTARLQERLVTQDRLASDVNGFITPFAEAGLVELHITAAPGVEVSKILTVLREELGKLADAIETSAVEKARNGLLLAHYDALRNVEGCAEALGHYQTTSADYTRAFTAPDVYASLEAEELCEVARQIFVAEHENVVVAHAADSTKEA